VVRGVGVDVRGGEVDGCGGGGGGREGLDGEDEVEEFGRVVGFGGVLQDGGLRFGQLLRQRGMGRFVAAEGHAVFEESGGDFREDGLKGGRVDEYGFDRVAGRGVVQFRVENDFDGHRGVGVAVDVDAAEAVGVAEDGDAGLGLDAAD